MADAPTTSVLGSVAPVLDGGLLAAASGAGTQWYQHKVKIDEEKRSRRAAKIEELVQAIYDHEHWRTIQRNMRVFGEKLEGCDH